MLTLQHFPHAETKVESYRFTLLVEARRQWKSLLGLWNMTPRHILWSTTLALCLFATVATVRWTIPACDISWSREESAFSPLAIETALFQCMSCAHPKIRHCVRYNTCSSPFSGSMVALTNAGQYPFMIAACESSTASLSLVFELVLASPNLICPKTL